MPVRWKFQVRAFDTTERATYRMFKRLPKQSVGEESLSVKRFQLEAPSTALRSIFHWLSRARLFQHPASARGTSPPESSRMSAVESH